MGKKQKHTGGTGGGRQRPRRRWVVPVLVAAVLVGGVIGWLVYPAKSPLAGVARYSGGARLAVDTELIDFGSVRLEKMVQARFRLKNVGDQPLRLAANPPLEVVEGC